MDSCSSSSSTSRSGSPSVSPKFIPRAKFQKLRGLTSDYAQLGDLRNVIYDQGRGCFGTMKSSLIQLNQMMASIQRDIRNIIIPDDFQTNGPSKTEPRSSQHATHDSGCDSSNHNFKFEAQTVVIESSDDDSFI